MNYNDEIKNMVEKSKIALQQLEDCTQAQADNMCRVIAKAVAGEARKLAEMAVKETGMGNVEDKVLKNSNIGDGIWTTMKNQKSVGIIREDEELGLTYVAKPKGVIGCVTPTTNPSLTSLGNAMLALKGRNTVIIAPHPRAKNVTEYTVDLMNKALKSIGAPENVIQIITEPSIEKTKELMSTVDVVVATGGMAMVKSAYSSGKPAFGVGQGNVQVIVGDDCNDYDKVARDIIMSRSFDNGIICAGDQCAIVHKDCEQLLVDALVRNGAYYSDKSDVIEKFKSVIFEDGHTAKEAVGKPILEVAEKAGVKIPEETRIVVLKAFRHGAEEPLCSEKMCPVLTLLTYDDFEEAVEIARTNLLFQGAGHTAVLHSNNKEYIEYASLRIPVCRLLVNVPGIASTGIGMMANIKPTPSIGCGSWGNNSISENLTYEHLINVSVIALPSKNKAQTSEEIWAD
ncbi:MULTISPECIES: aldehyde dehydrogenase family protein [unclassified Sedimentibacter]|uniref:aldehyde dehydrogenase family protein n=1 Tax=unclassified Sedimentibacter TaxID=2649220 RepID=UPI0027DF9D94|nr:aldehyde dehydrogenase family protein [Sedimentibacter sp. MB35-C1]WMJ78535.1 aldehyde dehydrogenase family protein [Sedimentibacter sp. MB35-C1]